MKLSKEERQAVKDLKNLAKRWPKTLGLFSSGSLYVMKLDDDGRFITKKGKTPWGDFDHMDQNQVVTIIYGIKNDGGDPW